MRRHLIILAIIAATIQCFAQKFETDIFNNLRYESKDGIYQSYLKKSIFGDLVFSDNMGNEVTLKKRYLDLEYGQLQDNTEEKFDIFRSMIRAHRQDKNYKATYSLDILDKIVIEDNRNRKVEIGNDIFGNETFKEDNNGNSISMRKNLNGALEYKANNKEAILQKDITNIWTYKDSSGNEFKFSSKTWSGLKNKFGTEENIFQHLIDEFLNI